jgi:hypothetical protein
MNRVEEDVNLEENWNDEDMEGLTDEMLQDASEDVNENDGASPRAVELRELAAIPEADTPSRKSKRRVNSGDEHSLDRAERIKAARNLDFAPEKGNSSTHQASFIHFSNECVIDNLNSVGISLGNSTYLIKTSVSQIKEVELERLAEGSRNIDRINEVFDKEEKEELENEEVDKLILNSLRCDIMNEVMDLGNVYPMDCKITPNQKSSTSSRNCKNKRRKSKNKGLR